MRLNSSTESRTESREPVEAREARQEPETSSCSFPDGLRPPALPGAGVEVSKARREDIKDLRRIIGDSWSELYERNFSADAVKGEIERYLNDASFGRMVDNDQGVFLTARRSDDGRPCGALYAVRNEPEESALLLYLYVDKTTRGAKVGERLLVELEARIGDVKRLTLDVYSENARALRFYERNGFSEVGRAVYSIGEAEGTWIRMAKPLS